MDFDSFFKLAALSPPGCNGLKFIFDENANRGHWEPDTVNYATSDLARSVLECLCQRMLEMVAELEVNLKNTQVLCAGGGSRQKIWLDILSSKLGVEIQPTQTDPLLGAAMMAV